jgi:hypothetical protein
MPDGSWLTTRPPMMGGSGLVFAQGHPDDVARLTEDEINSKIEAGEGDPIYQMIPVAKPLHAHATDLIKQRGPASFDKIFQYLRTRVPFDIKRFEVAKMLNTMLQRGEIELENNGLNFQLGEVPPAHIKDATKAPAMALNEAVIVARRTVREGDLEHALEVLQQLEQAVSAWLEVEISTMHARNPELQAAIDEAREALIGDSNDDEHDALVSLMEALGETIPERD